MNLADILSERAATHPSALAIVESRRGSVRRTTFAELNLDSRRIAALLRHTGLNPGDPVLIFHPMSSELYAILLGIFRIGAVAMFLDPSAGREHVERCCELQMPAALIGGPRAHLLRLTCPSLRRIRRKFCIGPALPGAPSLRGAVKLAPLSAGEPVALDSPALLTFTSGSTGLPKAAVRSHGFLLDQHRILQRHLDLVAGEVDLTTLPIFLLANLASGVTSVIPDADLRAPGAVDGGPILEQMTALGVTRVAASPAFFERLLAADRSRGGGLRQLQKIFTGGAPVFPRLLRKLSTAAPDAKVEAVYGSTEAEPIAHLAARALAGEELEAMRRGSGLLAGTPIPEIELRILRDQWGKPLGSLSPQEFRGLWQPAEVPGEIVVSGEHVLPGYLRGLGDDETKFTVAGQKWHRTGDAGKLDAAGRLWLLGRCAAKIADSRGQIYSLAVEAVTAEQPGVRRSAIVSRGGSRLLVFEPENGASVSEDDLRKTLSWAGLDEIRMIPRIPVDKRHNAKIDYPALFRMLR